MSIQADKPEYGFAYDNDRAPTLQAAWARTALSWVWEVVDLLDDRVIDRGSLSRGRDAKHAAMRAMRNASYRKLGAAR